MRCIDLLSSARISPETIEVRSANRLGENVIARFKEMLKKSSPRRRPGSSSLNFLDSGVRRNDDSVINQRFPKDVYGRVEK